MTSRDSVHSNIAHRGNSPRGSYVFVSIFLFLFISFAHGYSVEPVPTCCLDYQEIQKLDGKFVRVVGLYEQTVISKSPHKREEALQKLTPGPGLVQITTAGGTLVMLGIYYSSEAVRPASEVLLYHGKRVEVTGKLHAHTPGQVTDSGIEMQTMTNPYLSDIQSIILVSGP